MARLLVVDDEGPKRERIVRAASAVGFERDEIVQASTQAEAEELIDSLEPVIDFAVVDVVLTTLPAKTGLEVIQSLRDRHPHCKIIALTDKGGTEFGVEAMNAGADDFISLKWEYVNWYSLLQQRLVLWRGFVEGLATTSK